MGLSVTGVTDGKVYGALSPLYVNFLVGLGEQLQDVTVNIKTWSGDKTSDQPADFQYELFRNENQFGSGSLSTEFNVAPFCLDALEFDGFNGTYISSTKAWARLNYVVNYLDASLLPQSVSGNIYFLVTNGYNFFEQGSTEELLPVNFPSSSIKATIGSTLPVSVLMTDIAGSPSETISAARIEYPDGTSSLVSLTTGGNNSGNLIQVVNVPIDDVEYINVSVNNADLDSLKIYPTKPYKHNPYRIGFLDANGVISYIYLYGNKQEVDEYSRNSFQRYRGGSISNDTGTNSTFTTNGTETLTLNSDWVNEDFYGLLEQLMLSKYVFFEEESLSCGKNFVERAEADGAEVESTQCAADVMESFGVSVEDTIGEPSYEVSGRFRVDVVDTSVQRKRSVDGLINYAIKLKKAYNKIATFR